MCPLNDKNDKKNWALRRRELVVLNNVVFAARKQRALECESPWDRARGWLDASAPPPSSRAARSSLFFFLDESRERKKGKKGDNLGGGDPLRFIH